MQGAPNKPSGPRHRVACGQVGYTQGLRAGHKTGRAPQGTGENKDSDPRNGRREEGSGP